MMQILNIFNFLIGVYFDNVRNRLLGFDDRLNKNMFILKITIYNTRFTKLMTMKRELLSLDDI